MYNYVICILIFLGFNTRGVGESSDRLQAQKLLGFSFCLEALASFCFPGEIGGKDHKISVYVSSFKTKQEIDQIYLSKQIFLGWVQDTFANMETVWPIKPANS